MLFNSIDFLVFFPIVFFLYFKLPHKYRWALLLASSYIFYMWWKPEYLILILLSTGIDYIAGIKMAESNTKKRRKIFLILSLCSNLGLLFIFKYFTFFNEVIKEIFLSIGIPVNIPELSFLLPVGISFYTFQTLSYTIEIYRGNQEPEKHLGIFALYVAFFPQLVAGPIERSYNLLPQLKKKYFFDYNRVTNGLKLMLWGFYKKIVIADNLAIVVNKIYNNVEDYTGIYYIIATVFFAFQIYCDFSGYSDIAIGAAEIFGIKLMNNFNRPYYSKSIAEFWKRWHISLSTWFRDYLYISLGGNRVVKWKWYYNLFITFLISGLWHGAEWTFVAWGALNGFYLLFSIWTKGIRKSITIYLGLDKVPLLNKLLKVLTTFTLTCFAWIFFRANTLSDAIYIIKHLHVGVIEFFKDSFSGFLFNFNTLTSIIDNIGISRYNFLIIIFSILFMEFIHILQRKNKLREMLSKKPIMYRWFVYVSVTMAIFVFGSFTKQQFIYFQF